MSLQTPHHLSLAQKDHFREKGFLKLPEPISYSLLAQLKENLDHLCNPELPAHPGQAVLDGPMGQKFTIGVDKLVCREAQIFRRLMGSPWLLSLAEDLCGSDFFPVQDFAVIKTLGDGSQVNWHQDIVSGSRPRCIMIGIYLDPATEENGALRIIPQSHLSRSPICELQEMSYETIEMSEGEVLIHDLMLAHSSGPLSSFPTRRVVYFEFCEREKAIQDQLYSKDFIHLRTGLIPYAIKAYREQSPLAAFFDWKNSEKENYPTPLPIDLGIQNIYHTPLHSRPANYCFDHF